MKIKKLFFLVVALGLFASMPVYAAFDDVTLETTAILDVGGYDLTIYSASALLEDITVDASDFSVTMLAGSVIIVESADGVGFTHDAGDGYVTSEYCEGGVSRLGLAGAAGTITITPSGVCVPVVEEEEEEDNGGGGSSSSHRRSDSTPSASPVVTTPVQDSLIDTLRSLIQQFIAQGGTPSPAMLAFVGTSAGTSTNAGGYTRDLDVGDVGADVTMLQNFLIAQNKGPAALALKAHGTTTLFGPLTQAALAEYQTSVGISPAVGFFGPVTRAHVNGL